MPKSGGLTPKFPTITQLSSPLKGSFLSLPCLLTPPVAMRVTIVRSGSRVGKVGKAGEEKMKNATT
ncbi:MAG: hypothetical protein ABR903_10005 [Thermodesulfovibrionales bacterium]